METTRSRIDDFKNLILNVAVKDGGHLSLEQLPGSKLLLPENLIKDIPTVFNDENIHYSFSMGFEYFSPGMNAVVLGCKNELLTYLVARKVTPGGSVISCYSDITNLERCREKFEEAKRPDEPLAEICFNHTPDGDLSTHYSEISKYLENKPMKSATDYLEMQKFISGMKSENPLIADNSTDIVAFDVTNFASAPNKFWQTISEIYRILKKDGIFLFSILLADEKAEDTGYLCEDDIDKFTGTHKFYGLQCIGRTEDPYKVIDGKEIRYHNFVAFKGKEGPCMEHNHAVIYNGPWKEIHDDDGHVFPRGKRVAVCNKTFNILKKQPYKDKFTYVYSYIDIPKEFAEPFPCYSGILFRDPKVTKGVAQNNFNTATEDCSSSESINSGESCCG